MQATEIRNKMQKGKEFSIIEKFPKTSGKNRLNLLVEEIQSFLSARINSNKNPNLKTVEIEGYTKPLTFYDSGSEVLLLIGGQVSNFFYINKEKDEGGFVPVVGLNIDKQSDNLWECMNPEKGYIEIHFIHWQGPMRNATAVSFSKPDYNVSKMYAHRISFRMQRKISDEKIVIISFLKIKKEIWFRF